MKIFYPFTLESYNLNLFVVFHGFLTRHPIQRFYQLLTWQRRSRSIVSLYQSKYKYIVVSSLWRRRKIYLETWHMEYILGWTSKNKHYVTGNAYSQEMTKMIHNNEDVSNTFGKKKKLWMSSNGLESFVINNRNSTKTKHEAVIETRTT